MIYDTLRNLREQEQVLLVLSARWSQHKPRCDDNTAGHILPERQFFQKTVVNSLQPYDVVIIADAQKLSIRHVNSLQRHLPARNTRVFLIGDPNQQSKATMSNHQYFATLTFGQQHLIKLSD